MFNIVGFIFLMAVCYKGRNELCCCNAFYYWSERQVPAILKSPKLIAYQLHSLRKTLLPQIASSSIHNPLTAF